MCGIAKLGSVGPTEKPNPVGSLATTVFDALKLKVDFRNFRAQVKYNCECLAACDQIEWQISELCRATFGDMAMAWNHTTTLSNL